MHMRLSSEATGADWQRQLAWLAIPLMALARPEPLCTRLATHPEETNTPWDRRRPAGSSFLSPLPWAEERRRDESPAVSLRHLTKYE
jgi:hypothetical protein